MSIWTVNYTWCQWNWSSLECNSGSMHQHLNIFLNSAIAPAEALLRTVWIRNGQHESSEPTWHSSWVQLICTCTFTNKYEYIDVSTRYYYYYYYHNVVFPRIPLLGRWLSGRGECQKDSMDATQDILYDKGWAKKNFFSKYNDKKKLRPTRAQRPNPRANEKRSKMEIHSKSASSDIHARWTVLRENKVEKCGRGKTVRTRDDDGKEARGKITRKRAFLWINHFHSPGKCAENYLWEWAPFMCPFYLKVGRESLY